VTAPTILALVRHGESEWIAERRFQGRGDSPLTTRGLRQAKAVGARLAAPAAAPSIPVPDTAPAAIWHSPLSRATQTAQAIREAREADAPLRPLGELTELSQGEWEGLTHAEVSGRYPRQLAAWRADPILHHAPGGESLPDALSRAQAARDVILERLSSTADPVATETPAEPVLGYADAHSPTAHPVWAIVVAHDGVLRLLTLDLLGVHLRHFWSFPFALAAISVLDLGGGLARLRAHNLDEHITALDRSRS
jgi:broad specificity phosphatase PhoE